MRDLITFVSGSSQEVEADAYEQDGWDWVFSVAGDEVLRIPIERVAGISKGT